MSNPMYGQNKSDGALEHLIKTLNAQKKADSPDQLQFQVFETVVPAGEPQMLLLLIQSML